MNVPSTPIRFALALLVTALAPTVAAAAAGTFDPFVETFANDWIRADPIAATTSQYFEGAEQDAIDRQLTAKDMQYGTLGQLKILEVRAKAQRELGAKFSQKEFHNVVLRTGAVPLAVLETVLDAWIAREKGRG